MPCTPKTLWTKVLLFVGGLLNLGLLVESAHWLSLKGSFTFGVPISLWCHCNKHAQIVHVHLHFYSSHDWINWKATTNKHQEDILVWFISHLTLCTTSQFVPWQLLQTLSPFSNSQESPELNGQLHFFTFECVFREQWLSLQFLGLFLFPSFVRHKDGYWLVSLMTSFKFHKMRTSIFT